MTQEDRIKKKIRDNLKKLPHFKVYCILCKEYCTTASFQQKLMHFDCWIQWKKSLRKPT